MLHNATRRVTCISDSVFGRWNPRVPEKAKIMCARRKWFEFILWDVSYLTWPTAVESNGTWNQLSQFVPVTINDVMSPSKNGLSNPAMPAALCHHRCSANDGTLLWDSGSSTFIYWVGLLSCVTTVLNEIS